MIPAALFKKQMGKKKNLQENERDAKKLERGQHPRKKNLL